MNNMDNQENLTMFEFVLSLEGNIIIQRFFNVKNHNPESKRSMDLLYAVNEICNNISEKLKKKSFEYSYDSMNFLSNFDILDEGKDLKEENFLLEIKLNGDIYIQRIFPAHVYHPKARYSVDIRPDIRRILGLLSDVLSSTTLELEYLDYKL